MASRTNHPGVGSCQPHINMRYRLVLFIMRRVRYIARFQIEATVKTIAHDTTRGIGSPVDAMDTAKLLYPRMSFFNSEIPFSCASTHLLSGILSLLTLSFRRRLSF